MSPYSKVTSKIINLYQNEYRINIFKTIEFYIGFEVTNKY